MKTDQLDREELIDGLQAAYEELGESPTARWMRDHGAFHYRDYERIFGSWNEALKAAKLPINNPGNACSRLSKKSFLQDIRRVADDIGHPPSMKEFERNTNVMAQADSNAAPVARRCCGSWTDSLIEAGVLEPAE